MRLLDRVLLNLCIRTMCYFNPVGIANDIIQNGVNGYIYTSQKDLVEKFDYLYTHQNMIYQMGENNYMKGIYLIGRE